MRVLKGHDVVCLLFLRLLCNMPPVANPKPKAAKPKPKPKSKAQKGGVDDMFTPLLNGEAAGTSIRPLNDTLVTVEVKYQSIELGLAEEATVTITGTILTVDGIATLKCYKAANADMVILTARGDERTLIMYNPQEVINLFAENPTNDASLTSIVPTSEDPSEDAIVSTYAVKSITLKDIPEVADVYPPSIQPLVLPNKTSVPVMLVFWDVDARRFAYHSFNNCKPVDIIHYVYIQNGTNELNHEYVHMYTNTNRGVFNNTTNHFVGFVVDSVSVDPDAMVGGGKKKARRATARRAKK